MRGKFLIGAASAAMLAAIGLAPSASAQTADPAGDASTSARLALGQAMTNELAPEGDIDWYRLSVSPGNAYDITLTGISASPEVAPFDTMLVVYNGDGEEVARNDDADGTLNSALSYRPSTAGDVFVEVRGFSDTAAGQYTLAAEARAVAPDDAGNDAATRARLAPNQSASGVIEEASDEDWYRLNVRTGQIYRISLNGAEGANALADPLLRLVDGEGNELASNDDSNESLNSYLEYAPSRSGDVFVVATAFGDSTGAYTLRAEASRLPPDNAGNGEDTRARLAIGESVSGTLDYPNDRDWFRTRLVGGQSYRFSLSSPENGFDPLLRIYNRAAEELGMDDDGGDGLNSYLEFTAPSDGEYFVEARGFVDDAVGAYTLTAAAGDIPSDMSTDASLSADGDYREGVLSPAGDKDWYRINLAEGQAMRIAVDSVEGNDALSDPYIVLHGPDGAEVARDDDGGEGLNAWLEYIAPSAGAYYLEVRGFIEDSAEGRYAVMLTAGEIGNSIDSADYVTANGEGRASTIAPSGDVDWFSINLIEGRPYRFNVEATDGSLDPLLRLLDEQGNEVALDDDGGSGLNAYLTYVSPTGGSYYAAVSAFNDGSTGGYNLRISDTDVPGNSGTDETLSSEGDDRVSLIEIAGDRDFYRADLQAGSRYEITVSGTVEAPLPDPYLTILNSSGESIATDDDSGPGNNARLVFTPDATDSYYIQASGLGASVGRYVVSIIPQTPRQ